MTTITPEEAMDKFKTFCTEEIKLTEEDRLDYNDEQDWTSLSLGFFKALGIDSDTCHDLARIARYEYHYWSF